MIILINNGKQVPPPTRVKMNLGQTPRRTKAPTRLRFTLKLIRFFFFFPNMSGKGRVEEAGQGTRREERAAKRKGGRGIKGV